MFPSPTFVINSVSVQLGSGTEISLNLSRSMRCLSGSGKTIFSQEVGSGNDDKENESKERGMIYISLDRCNIKNDTQMNINGGCPVA